MPGPGVPEAEALLRRVEPSPEAARRVREHLTRTPTPPEDLPTVSVSRLVNPGRAFYEVLHPLSEDLVAQQKRLAGSGAHDLLEASLAAGAEQTEVWLQGEESVGEPYLERVTARVDAVELRPDGSRSPVEIKNVGSAIDRPSDEYLEQLGMYCALLGVEEGRVLAVHRDDARGTSQMLPPWKVRYADLGLIRREMARRRDLLTEAVRNKDPARLPACPWWSSGCRYQEAKVCDCVARPALEPVIARSATVAPDPDYLATLHRRAAEREALRTSKGDGLHLTLSRLLTPRKAYFSALPAVAAPRETEGVEAGAADGQRALAERSVERVNLRGLERQVFAAIRSTARESYRKIPVGKEEMGAEVPVVEGRPFLVRVRHVARALSGGPTELAGRWGVPDDLRQLALRASLVGTTGARVYVWNWKLTDPDLKLQVFDVEFDPELLRSVQAYALGLPGRLRGDIERGDHRDLPLCPTWMCPRCEFRDRCQPELG